MGAGLSCNKDENDDEEKENFVDPNDDDIFYDSTDSEISELNVVRYKNKTFEDQIANLEKIKSQSQTSTLRKSVDRKESKEHSSSFEDNSFSSESVAEKIVKPILSDIIKSKDFSTEKLQASREFRTSSEEVLSSESTAKGIVKPLLSDILKSKDFSRNNLQAKTSRDTLREAVPSSRSVKEVRTSSRSVREVIPSNKSVKEIIPSTRSVKEFTSSSKSVKEVFPSSRSVKEVVPSSRSVKEDIPSSRCSYRASSSIRSVHEGINSSKTIKVPSKKQSIISKESSPDIFESVRGVEVLHTDKSINKIDPSKTLRPSESDIFYSSASVKKGTQSNKSVREFPSKEISSKNLETIESSSKRSVIQSSRSIKEAAPSIKSVREEGDPSNRSVNKIISSSKSVKEASERHPSVNGVQVLPPSIVKRARSSINSNKRSVTLSKIIGLKNFSADSFTEASKEFSDTYNKKAESSERSINKIRDPSSKSIKEVIPSSRSVKEVATSSRSINEIVPSNRSVKEIDPSSRSVKEPVHSSRSVKEVGPSSRSVKDIVPSSRSVKEVGPSSRSVKDTVPSSRSVKEVVPSSRSVKEVDPYTGSVRDIVSSSSSVKEVNPSNRSVREITTSNKSVKELTPSGSKKEVLSSHRSIKEVITSSGSVINISTEEESVEETEETFGFDKENEDPDLTVKKAKSSSKSSRSFMPKYTIESFDYPEESDKSKDESTEGEISEEEEVLKSQQVIGKKDRSASVIKKSSSAVGPLKEDEEIEESDLSKSTSESIENKKESIGTRKSSVAQKRKLSELEADIKPSQSKKADYKSIFDKKKAKQELRKESIRDQQGSSRKIITSSVKLPTPRVFHQTKTILEPQPGSVSNIKVKSFIADQLSKKLSTAVNKSDFKPKSTQRAPNLEPIQEKTESGSSQRGMSEDEDTRYKYYRQPAEKEDSVNQEQDIRQKYLECLKNHKRQSSRKRSSSREHNPKEKMPELNNYRYRNNVYGDKSSKTNVQRGGYEGPHGEQLRHSGRSSSLPRNRADARYDAYENRSCKNDGNIYRSRGSIYNKPRQYDDGSDNELPDMASKLCKCLYDRKGNNRSPQRRCSCCNCEDCCGDCPDDNNGFVEFELAYQQAGRYPELVEELEESISQRNKERFQRSMKRFEMLSRYGKADSTLVDDEDEEFIYTNRPTTCPNSGAPYCTQKYCENEYRQKYENAPSKFGNNSTRAKRVPSDVFKQKKRKNSKWQMDPRTGEWYKVTERNYDFENNFPPLPNAPHYSNDYRHSKGDIRSGYQECNRNRLSRNLSHQCMCQCCREKRY